MKRSVLVPSVTRALGACALVAATGAPTLMGCFDASGGPAGDSGSDAGQADDTRGPPLDVSFDFAPGPDLGESSGESGACPLLQYAKDLIREGAARAARDVARILGGTSIATSQRGVSRSLIDESKEHASNVRAPDACTVATTPMPTCEPCSAPCPAREKCIAVGCAGPGVESIKASWRPAPVSYTTDGRLLPSALVRYETEPAIELTIRKDADALAITWRSTDSVTAAIDEIALNASSELSGNGVVGPDGSRGGTSLITYSTLTSTSESVAVSITTAATSAGGAVTGSVRLGERLVGELAWADVTAPGEIKWRAPCDR